jgi:hypothetical protein
MHCLSPFSMLGGLHGLMSIQVQAHGACPTEEEISARAELLRRKAMQESRLRIV